MPLSAIELTLFADQLQSVCEEMGQVLQLSAFSPNIRERRDFSCALFTADGRLVAQGRNIPVHLGSMSAAVQSVLADVAARGEEFAAGDVLLVNDPYRGGTHLPDITAVAPYFAKPGSGAAPLALLAARAHHADVGGMSSGSLPLSSELFQEGLVIPPVWLRRGAILQQDILQLVCANSRTPLERVGDLSAQLAALVRGEQRLIELARNADVPGPVSARVFAELMERSARAVADFVTSLPKARVEASDELELPDGSRALISLALTVNQSGISFDFSHSSRQVLGPLNAVRAIVQSAVFYVLRCLLPPEVPSNEGLLDRIEIITAPGTIVDALPPAAVAGGNVETSQRLVDVVLQAWSKLLPGRIPALSQGTMNNLTIGGLDERWTGRRPFVYYETIGGGHGGHPEGHGASGRHTHMTNSLNTPVEAIEHAFPLRIWRYGLRRGSGGKGRQPGGEGIVRELELLADSDVTMLSQRRRRGPRGAAGGKAGASGCNTLLLRKKTAQLGGCFSRLLAAGTRLRIETPGGGGWGK
jgi:N-methylhydantoinase B